ncbi:MAG: ATPase [Candidatus Altiarchaeales archaeon]|nr:MAG: ATPase [Candidatus Altiarchaeales archaeon]
MMIKRVPSGITGLDNLIQGGFPDGFCILVSGPPGVGKTIFTLQFLMESARRGEAGVYITLDQRIKDLRNQAKQFGWNFHEYEMGGFVRFMRPSKGSAWNQNITETIKESKIHYEILPVIRDSVAEIDAKRLVIDSLSTLTLSLPRGFGDGEIRLFLKRLVDEVKSLGVTSIVTSDLPKNSKWLSRDGVSEFVCDGVIVLDDVVFGEDPVRILRIPKMRETEQDRKAHFFKITSDGIVVEV